VSTATLTVRGPQRAVVINPRCRSCSFRRYYDPTTGQFISVDPAVDETEAPYAYVNGDPTNAIDPDGLCCSLGGAWSAIDNHVVHPVANALEDLNPLSPANPIQQWAASGSFGSNLLRWNPAYIALNGYANEAKAYESGCSLWTVAKYGAEGAGGVALTGLVATGGAALATGQQFGDIAFQSRLIGAQSRLFGNGSLIGRSGFSGLLNPAGKGAWRIGWSVKDTLPIFRVNTPWIEHIDLFGASQFWR
jgi:hypothetical protein